MRTLTVFLLCALLAVTTASAASAALPKMRPYTGIGILVLSATPDDLNDFPSLYEEPGISRLGSLNPGKVPRYEWIFGPPSDVVPLVVSARKGPWLKVAYDDAGREAWVNPARPGTFQPWDLYLKGHVSRLLPGLQKKYYQFYKQPGRSALSVLTTGQFLKVLRLDNDWAMVLTDNNALGWLRWRDEDGRLLIGVVSVPRVMQP